MEKKKEVEQGRTRGFIDHDATSARAGWGDPSGGKAGGVGHGPDFLVAFCAAGRLWNHSDPE